MGLEVVPLDPAAHNRPEFSCGCDPLDQYVRTRANSDRVKGVAVCYVLVDTDQPSAILGFYTLSSIGIELQELPEAVRKRLPKYPHIPATLLGRLAVDIRYRGQGHGEILLLDALKRALAASDAVASALVVVDPQSARAVSFYRQYGFSSLLRRGSRLFLPMATIQQLNR